MSPHRPTHRPDNVDRGQPGDQYLWDRGAPVDPQIARLEQALAPMRYRPEPLRIETHPAVGRMPRAWAGTPLRAAAMLAITIGGAWAFSLFTTSVEQVGEMKMQRNALAEAWNVATLEGAPRVGEQSVTGNGLLRVGQWVETDSSSAAEIAVGDFGTVKVQPDSRLRLVRSQQHERRLELARGTIEARISAPPRLFIVDTPGAAAVDLGCAYRMTVEQSGSAIIEVTGGWVSMEREGIVSIVPGGAMCRTRPGFAPGTPFYRTASPGLVDALEWFDFRGGSGRALATVVNQSRESDSLTLWHLLSRAPQALRGAVFDRLASFSPPPSGVTRQAIIDGDVNALAQWRDTFMWSPGH